MSRHHPGMPNLPRRTTEEAHEVALARYLQGDGGLESRGDARSDPPDDDAQYYCTICSRWHREGARCPVERREERFVSLDADAPVTETSREATRLSLLAIQAWLNAR